MRVETLAPPLAGVRVLELARILAGPWAGQLLADLGADVIKVESPSGDDTRRWGPPFVEMRNGDPGDAAYFHACNRGKRSIAIDLGSSAGREAVEGLIRRSDVLIENFKVGDLKKFGLDYEQVRKINPRLVYCSISGFGQDGPYAPRPGYDFIAQGMGGVMDLTGEPDGDPQKMGVAFADLFTGLYAVVAIQAALRERERSGCGQHIDVALLDSMVGVLANQALNFLVSGASPQRLGNCHPNIAPYQVFQAADGPFTLAVGNDRQFEALCAAFDAAPLAQDARFTSNSGRVMHREELAGSLTTIFRDLDRAEVLARCQAAGVPAGGIHTVAEVFADPQVQARGLRMAIPAPWAKEGVVPGVRSPIRFSRSPLADERASPLLDEHADEILHELALWSHAVPSE